MKSGMRKLFLTLLLLAVIPTLRGQQRQAAFEMNQRLGRGINIGNTFEAPSETAWGNPWKPEYFRIISGLGFRHVRIPIRWETAARSSAVPPYTVEASFLARIRQVVDTALKYKLHAIINMHHHDSLFARPDREKDRFIAQWDQIARYFSHYPDSLLFEVLNEPHGALTPDKWNLFFADALAEVRKSNPHRFVLAGTAEWGGLAGLGALQLPEDERIILTLHYYNPFQFTHQGAEWSDGSAAWLGTEWLDTEAERETVRSEFRAAATYAQTHHIPIHVGEFGAYSKAGMASRVRWTTFLARWFEEQGFSWAYWEFSAGFGIYNPSTRQLSTPLTEALLHNPLPAPTPVQLTPLYTSNFSTGNDGWYFNAQQGAAGSLSRSGGKLIVSLANGGTEGWHAQLTRGNISLVKGKKYQVTLKVSAPATRTVTLYLGKAGGDWAAYSGYNTFTFTPAEETFVFSFTMSGENDPAARMVFDLGKSSSGILLASVKIEEVTILTAHKALQNPLPVIFPNPADETIYLQNAGIRTRIEILTLEGKPVFAAEVAGERASVPVGHLPGGIYLVVLRSETGASSRKIFVY